MGTRGQRRGDERPKAWGREAKGMGMRGQWRGDERDHYYIRC